MWVEKKGWHKAKIAEAIGQILLGFLAPGKALSFQVVGKASKKCPAIIDGLGTLLKAVNAAIANGQVGCFSVTTSREP